MKKVFLAAMATFAVVLAVSAQPGGGGFQRRTPEERAAVIHQKIDSAFKLDATKMANLDTALVTLYRAQDKKREEFFSGGNMPDRETMQAEMKKFSDAQAEIIKAVLTEEQYGIWTDKIAPTLRPQRPGGGGPGGGGRN